MRNLKCPPFTTATVFDECVNSMGNAGRQKVFVKAKSRFTTAESDYLNAASNHTLYQLSTSTHPNDTAVFDGLTQGDLKSLYTAQMVPSKIL